MLAYEAMFIFKPDLSEEAQKTLVDKLENILKENQAVIENSQPFGRRHLAYGIKKCREGIYYLMNFSTDSGAVVAKLIQSCNVNESILRALVVKKGLSKKSAGL